MHKRAAADNFSSQMLSLPRFGVTDWLLSRKCRLAGTHRLRALLRITTEQYLVEILKASFISKDHCNVLLLYMALSLFVQCQTKTIVPVSSVVHQYQGASEGIEIAFRCLVKLRFLGVWRKCPRDFAKLASSSIWSSTCVQRIRMN